MMHCGDAHGARATYTLTDKICPVLLLLLNYASAYENDTSQHLAVRLIHTGSTCLAVCHL